MFYYTYIIKSQKTCKLYIGSSGDLRKRIKDHNKGTTKSTKSGIPWVLIYYEAHRSKSLAIKAERHYKTGQGRRQIKKKLGLK
ncbi:MAG: GIY-YIG nuclease family protein [Patescibacteria group bacterium]